MLPLAEIILCCCVVSAKFLSSSQIFAMDSKSILDSGEVFAAGDNRLGQVSNQATASEHCLALTKLICVRFLKSWA